jgi:hypothetical protein
MGSEGVTAQAVGKQLKLDKSSARRRLHGATDAGLIKNLETRKFQPGLYRTTDVDQDTQELLPTVNELLDGWCTVARLLATVTTWERWQNPLPPFLSPLSYCFSDTKGYRWHGGTGGKGFQTYRPFGANIGSTYSGGGPRPCEAARPRAAAY